jgi:hypothetical protein
MESNFTSIIIIIISFFTHADYVTGPWAVQLARK